MSDEAGDLPDTYTRRDVADRQRLLTDKQQAFIQYYVRHAMEQTEAARLAGYANATQAGWELLRNSKILSAIHELRQRIIQTEGANVALDTMKELMKPGNPAGTRFNAAKYFLDAAGHGAKEQDGEQKSLDEMSPDELAQQIAKLDEALVKLGDQAKPVTATVIENESGTKGA